MSHDSRILRISLLLVRSWWRMRLAERYAIARDEPRRSIHRYPRSTRRHYDVNGVTVVIVDRRRQWARYRHSGFPFVEILDPEPGERS